ncbi:xanthine dehydrogenase family protein molybdopterin-binding subunit [Catalinimonas niigatensis]|uniref:xanthine dehydrogenase family protein molybdopterin-binding subunit n=1 Tax=Catalinimonas niigatensis TaxID=1397264 RepID=UPI00266649ED|nr:molybdopterin cofactor-binding domain-containing protein [Catalinimonas niigatensis]WPP48599.1 molybdopterin cofactor-binding domain-containing protein [Catalinimonas niigatensis]
MKTKTSHSRRDFLKTTGCLTITFPIWTSCGLAAGEIPVVDDSLPGSLLRNPAIKAWLQVLEDGTIQVYTGKIELGQGIRTAIGQVAAEELNTDPDLIEVHLVETGVTPDEGYTAGSGSIVNSAMSVRYAAAAAKAKLLEMAAQKLGVPVEKLAVKDGKILLNGQQKMSFAELLEGKQLEDKVTAPVTLKPKKEHQWVGKAVPRQGINRMVRGEEVYIQDLRFPGMVHARAIRPIAYQSQLQSFDEEGLKKQVKGLLKVVVNGSFLGVITEDEYQAVKAQEFLQKNAQWTKVQSLPVDQPLNEYLRGLPSRKESVENKGSFNATEKTIKASYFKPYIMHASIGPSCAVALYDQGELHIWSNSQGVYPLRDSLKEVVGLPVEKIHIKGVPGSGCYGHNGSDDAAADVALIAMAYPGKHIRLQWSREDEHAWEPYGSAMIIDTEASLDASGKINQWKCELWSDSHSTRPGGDPGNLMTAHYLEKPFPRKSYGYSGGGYRNADPYYKIPNLKIDANFFEGPLRVSSLRGLGAYANIFAIESFMDELAEQAGKDPLAFRLMHSEDERAIAVMKKLGEMIKNQQAGENEGIGYAFSRYKNSASYCAVAAKVKVNKSTGHVQVQQMWGVIDAGEVINLDGLKNQTEGGMVQSASWALKEEVKFDQQHVNNLNWGSYPIFRFSDVPQVEVVVLDQPDKAPLGAGEAAQGPSTAAIANAVYKACGKRVRHLPIRADKIKG